MNFPVFSQLARNFRRLYAASTSLPGLLQSLFGYDALSAGLFKSLPRSLFDTGNATRM
jgi:hypothetical protein